MTFNYDLINQEKTNNFIQQLPNKTGFDDWTLSQLIIHLWKWDEEIIHLLEAQISGNVKSLDYNSLTDEEKADMVGYFQFEYQQMRITLEEWNEMMMEKYKDRSADSLKKELQHSRKNLVATFKKHIEYFKDKPKVTKQTVSIWKHDIHHLKKGGFTKEEILQENN